MAPPLSTLPGSNHTTVRISAISGGYITLPESAFVSPADASVKRYVPSLSFLITHPNPVSTPPALLETLPKDRPIKILFDLGLRQSASAYLPGQQAHLKNREPHQLFPGVPETLRSNGIRTEEIDLVILSHVHYDHHGDPKEFPNAQFLVGPGALDILENGLPPELGSHQIFDPHVLPRDRAVELPATSSAIWKPLGPFPHAIDILGDASLYVIDTPGHLPGHINLLCRLDGAKWVCLAGDAFHDPRLLSGERKIGTWENEAGQMCCIHLEKQKAEESIQRLRELQGMGVEIVAAHDDAWEKMNEARFLRYTTVVG